MERADIKLVIDQLDQYATGDSFQATTEKAADMLEHCSDEIASLKQQLADAQKDAERVHHLYKWFDTAETFDEWTRAVDNEISAQKESPQLKNCATCVHGDTNTDFNRLVPCSNCDPNTLSEWKQKEEAMPTNTVFTVTEEDVDSAIKAVRNSL